MSIVRGLFAPGQPPFEPHVTDDSLRSIEAELGLNLPAAYVDLSRAHNGGVLAKNAHPMSSPTSWATDHVAAYSLAAIGRSAQFSLCGDHGTHFWIAEWGYPDLGVYFADCPSAGHDMLALDYREPGEPRVVHVDQEWDYAITMVAPDFASFIGGLTDEGAFDRSDA